MWQLPKMCFPSQLWPFQFAKDLSQLRASLLVYK